jgi:hypothetical protein
MSEGSTLQGPMAETITAWQCIGCGRLEAPQNCVGVCQDRKVELVTAWDYAEVRVALDAANERIATLEAFLGKTARTAPREGHWEQSYRAMQAEARKLLEASTGG